MGCATWLEAKLVNRCSTRLVRARQGDGWSVCGGDGGNHGCNTRQDWRMQNGRRGSVTARRGVNGATRNWKRKENKAERKRVGREQTRGAPIFLIRCGQSHQFLAEWLNNESVPMGSRQRLMQLVLVNFPCAAWVHDKFDQQKSDHCSLCRKALREEIGANFVSRIFLGRL